MTRRPPKPTLFPNTTLFRSRKKKNGHPKVPVVGIGPKTLSHGAPGAAPPVAEAAVREGDEPCCGGAAVAAPIAGTLLRSPRPHLPPPGGLLGNRQQGPA